MNEVKRIGAVPVSVIKPLPASPSVSGGNGPQPGKPLPLKVPVTASQPSQLPDIQQSVENIQANIKAAVAQMNEYIQSTQRDLQFSYDPDSGQTVVKVLDRSSQEVIRQIPDEIFLKLAKTLGPDEPLPLVRAEA